jgi:hypothetical protein
MYNEHLVERELAKERELLGDIHAIATSSTTNPIVCDMRLDPSCQDYNRQLVSFCLQMLILL